MKKYILAALCLAPMAVPLLYAGSADFPSWAYPVDLPPKPGAQPPKPKDESKLFQAPGSEVKLTRAQIEAAETVADWHPSDHPPMPDVVKNGKPKVRACAFCHMPDGAGRPETTALAGLPEGYIKQEVMNFRAGARKGSEPNRLLQKQMVEVAANISDADLAEAAAYFSSLKLGSNLKVVEADMVPQTFVTGGMLAALPEGGMEPIGSRIIEVPEDLERAEMRDPKTAYIAYVPPGSIAKGQALVSTGGGKTTACGTCHGPDLHGQGDVPHIAGRSPSYVMRQFFDIQNNTRTASVTFMQQVVANLSRDDMIAIAAYLASRQP
jgi:cytochrome c553